LQTRQVSVKHNVRILTINDFLVAKMPRASKQKDPNAPKRPLSAFFIFSQDERPKIKSQNASLSVADVAKVIGEKWRAAPEDLKRKYEKAAKEAKERYEIELQAYKQAG